MDVAIGAGSVLFGMLITYLTFMRGRDKEIKTDATENAKVSVKLNHISSGVDDIKLDLKTNERQINRLNTELVKVNESVKSAHKRIDNINKEDER